MHLGGAELFIHRRSMFNPDVLWLGPLTDLPLFLAIGGATYLLLRRRYPRHALLLAAAVLLFLGAFEPLVILTTRLQMPAVIILAAGIAAAFTRLIFADEKRAIIWLRRLAIVELTVCAAGGLVLHAARFVGERNKIAALGNPTPGAPNVILIVLDAVRAPDVGTYGNSRRNTPFLDHVASEGAVFRHAYANTTWTLPSHASFFTGRYPIELRADWLNPFESGPRTLAEYFDARGYRTAAFSANLGYVARGFGLDRGFQHFSDFEPTLSEALRANSILTRVVVAIDEIFGTPWYVGYKPATRVTSDALRWAGTQTRPFFMYLNYFDAHSPHIPPAPYDTLYSGHPRHFRSFGDLDVSSRRPVGRSARLAELRQGYDAAIAYEDAEIRRLFGGLQAAGLLQNAIVVITSDHGDLFGEYGLIQHGNSLYPLLLHIPLIAYAPGRVPADTAIVTPVSLRDLPATLAQLSGDTASRFPGTPLLSRQSAARGGPTQPSPIFSTLSKFPGVSIGPNARGAMRSLIAGRWQYIHNGDGVEELYDVGDSLATTNLAGRAEYADTLRAMRERISRLP
ncbi:MAG TPA: sulfatase [Gemmatimonadales bacterium]|jgi:arylsulfatase A-like enzyme